MISIRHEQPGDFAAIRRVNELAFGQQAEGDLVDRLRAAGNAILSLVAVEDDQVVGHLLFSPVTIECEAENIAALGLAPMAVLPEWQNRGIGSQLVRAGLDECRRAGHQCIVVLGHHEYYPRFGFVPASRYGVSSEYNVADENFMLLELRAGSLPGRKGIAKYQPEFNEWK
ncbi:MAG: N-acetyltransferase [Blastocatellia bacterium]